MPPHPTTYFLRKFVREVGKFNTNYKVSSDYDFLIRALITKRYQLFTFQKLL